VRLLADRYLVLWLRVLADLCLLLYVRLLADLGLVPYFRVLAALDLLLLRLLTVRVPPTHLCQWRESPLSMCM
jgi:hypothetical protein